MAEIVGRRERKKQLSRQAILKAAQQLFTVRGYKETSVADIMNGADLGTGTFYNYFQSKEEVLMALLGDSVEMVEAAVRESRERGDRAVETLAAGIMATSIFLDENRYVLPLFLSASERAAESHHPQGMGHPGAGHGSATPGFKAIFEEIISRGQLAGEIRDDVPAELIAETLHSIYQAAAFSKLDIPFRENVRMKTCLLLNGIRKEKQPQKCPLGLQGEG